MPPKNEKTKDSASTKKPKDSTSTKKAKDTASTKKENTASSNTSAPAVGKRRPQLDFDRSVIFGTASSSASLPALSGPSLHSSHFVGPTREETGASKDIATWLREKQGIRIEPVGDLGYGYTWSFRDCCPSSVGSVDDITTKHDFAQKMLESDEYEKSGFWLFLQQSATFCNKKGNIVSLMNLQYIQNDFFAYVTSLGATTTTLPQKQDLNDDDDQQQQQQQQQQQNFQTRTSSATVELIHNQQQKHEQQQQQQEEEEVAPSPLVVVSMEIRRETLACITGRAKSEDNHAPAIIFEIKNVTGGFVYALCQLEIRLFYYFERCKLRLEAKEKTKFEACVRFAGIHLCDQHQDVEKAKKAATQFPLINSLLVKGNFAVLCTEFFKPKAVWVQQKLDNNNPIGAAFSVTPQVNNVDSLKDAIKAKMGTDYTGNPGRISVYDKSNREKQLDVIAPLEGNDATTPYFFVLPDNTKGTVAVSSTAPPLVWVQQKLGNNNPFGAAFSVTPQVNNVDSLKDAIKAKRSVLCKDIDAPDLTIFDSNRKELRPSLALDGSSEERPYFFVLPDSNSKK